MESFRPVWAVTNNNKFENGDRSMVTLKEISADCGISVTQVSRALNGYSDVSEETRTKVLESADKLGYVKNIMASSLVKQNSNMIALVIEGSEVDQNADNVGSPNIYHIELGVSKSSMELGLEPFIYLKHRKQRMDYVAFCKQRYISGIILFGSNYDDPDRIALENSGFPCVFIDITTENEGCGCVVTNNSYYSKIAVDHMLAHGCQKIAVIAGSPQAYVTHERLSGYQTALSIRNFPYLPELIYYANFNTHAARKATRSLLEKNPDIDGFFCMSDEMALACMEEVTMLGKKIPDDIRIFGFDGNQYMQFVRPRLTTMQQDFTQKGIASVHLLNDIIQKRPCSHTLYVPCKMLPGETV